MLLDLIISEISHWETGTFSMCMCVRIKEKNENETSNIKMASCQDHKAVTNS